MCRQVHFAYTKKTGEAAWVGDDVGLQDPSPDFLEKEGYTVAFAGEIAGASVKTVASSGGGPRRQGRRGKRLFFGNRIGLKAIAGRSSRPSLLQCVQVCGKIVNPVGIDNQVRHRPMRGMQQRAESDSRHARRIGNCLKCRRIWVGRLGLPGSDGMAIGASSFGIN
jgi:hypothetical protein